MNPLDALAWHALVAAAQGVDVTPLLVAIIASLSGSAVTAALTLRRTNRKLAAEGEKLYQEALSAAEERGQKAVATIDNIRRALEERLAATEQELAQTREQLATAEADLRVMEARTAAVSAERDRIVAEAQHERDLLQLRITSLEEQVVDLQTVAGDRRRRRERPHPE